MRTRASFLLVCGLAALTSAARAEELPVERLFAAPAIHGAAPRGVRLSPDGAYVTYLKPEASDQNLYDLWALPVHGGAARRLVEGSAVEPKDAVLSEAEKSRRERERIGTDHGVVDYSWDALGRQILIPAGGNLYLADAATGATRRLEQVGGAAVDATVSPKGRYVVYVLDQNLYAIDLGTGARQALTTQGGGAISYGVAEFVAQEEMGRYTGYWPAPDDRRIAYTRVDESGVEVVPRFDIGASGVTVVNQRYPRAGHPNARVELYVAALDTAAAPVRVDLGDDADVYLARVNWSRDGRTLYVQRESRDQTRLDLLAVDPASGAAKVLLTEHQTPWINLNDDFRALADGNFIWGSERTGYHHIYLYRPDGTLVRPITQGDWPLAGGNGAGLTAPAVSGVDEKAGLVYFIASMDGPLEQHLYVTSYRKVSAPRRITSGQGWWDVAMAKDQQSFVGSYTDPRTPEQTALYARDGRRLAWIEENALRPGHPYWPYLDHLTYPEFGTLRAEDGQALYYSVRLPYGFDPAKKYPAVIRVYGGPGVDSTVRRLWSGGSDQLLAQAGYVVFWLDNRGTLNRGLKFESVIHKSLGSAEVRDQLLGVRYLASLPYVDAARIGVMGWSYGGFMTLRMLTEPGSGLRAGIAGGPPSDWRFYDTHYTEHYMGDPRTDAAAYDGSALLPRLGALAQPGAPRLLLAHGMADDNVVFENSTRIMAALQAQGTVFDLALYPGERHGVEEPAKEAQLWKTYLEFLARNLGAPR